MADPSNVLVIDNGADVTKLGLSTQSKPQLIPNFYAKSKKGKTKFPGLFARDVLWDISGLYYQRPFTRGYPCDWELQEELWSRMFEEDTKIDPSGKHLILSLPIFTPTPIVHSAMEVVFETFNVSTLFCAPPPIFTAHGHHSPSPHASPSHSCMVDGDVGVDGRKAAQMVVDAGYSFTHVVPVVHGSIDTAGVRRIRVGGKVLTNLLKETISFRAWDMMEETFLMNIIKERACFVSRDFVRDMEHAKMARNPFTRYYALPNYTSADRGRILSKEEAVDIINPLASGIDAAVSDAITRSRAPGTTQDGSDMQILVLNNERMAIPEVLFRPSDAGISQMGLGEAIVHSLSTIEDASTRAQLLGNIVLSGGCCNMPGLVQRLHDEVRAHTDADMDVNVYMDECPDQSAWHGACAFSNTESYVSSRCPMQTYIEVGKHACIEKLSTHYPAYAM